MMAVVHTRDALAVHVSLRGPLAHVHALVGVRDAVFVHVHGGVGRGGVAGPLAEPGAAHVRVGAAVSVNVSRALGGGGSLSHGRLVVAVINMRDAVVVDVDVGVHGGGRRSGVHGGGDVAVVAVVHMRDAVVVGVNLCCPLADDVMVAVVDVSDAVTVDVH